MGDIELSSDDDVEWEGPEDPEPAEEPRCWEHHSNVCGCPEGPVAASASGAFSSEPPFPPGWKHPAAADDVPEPRRW